MNTVSSSHSSRPLTVLRPVIAAIAAALFCVAAGSSRLASAVVRHDQRWKHYALGVPLTENFDTLASTGTDIAWTDNSTIPGWYSTRATYNSGTGSSNTGALYSFGVAGTNPVTDRALGSVASGTTGDRLQAARLTNNTGAHDYFARHQLRRRAVAQRRQRDRAHAHVPVPGRQRRRRHRRQCSGDRLDDLCAALSFTGPIATAQRPPRSTATPRRTALRCRRR